MIGKKPSGIIVLS